MSFKSRITTCIEFLHICRDDSTTQPHTRRYFAQKAADYGLSCEAIAEALGVPVGVVAALLEEGK